MNWTCVATLQPFNNLFSGLRRFIMFLSGQPCLTACRISAHLDLKIRYSSYGHSFQVVSPCWLRTAGSSGPVPSSSYYSVSLCHFLYSVQALPSIRLASLWLYTWMALNFWPSYPCPLFSETTSSYLLLCVAGDQSQGFEHATPLTSWPTILSFFALLSLPLSHYWYHQLQTYFCCRATREALVISQCHWDARSICQFFSISV